tara:strand:+ start:835 stop:951 length:117 start_codon:yes stop_codon:yes gene_type:complete
MVKAISEFQFLEPEGVEKQFPRLRGHAAMLYLNDKVIS